MTLKKRLGCLAVVSLPCAAHEGHSIIVASRDDTSWLAAEALTDVPGWRQAVVLKLEYFKGEEDVILEALRRCT